MDDSSPYNDGHRAFLQALIARSTLTFEEAKPILAAILTTLEGSETLSEDVDDQVFASYIRAVNERLSPLDMEIRNTYHQKSRQRVYALVNMTSDPLTQLATPFSADEISFVKRVLDGMFETNNTARREILAISAMDAVNLHKASSLQRRTSQSGDGETQGSTGAGLTQVQAERVLKALVEQGWFEKSRTGFYSLSPRALMELRTWLMDTYNDADASDDDDNDDNAGRSQRIKLCHACRDIVTMGQRCPKRSCQCRLHDFCAHNYFRSQSGRACPLCKTEWTGEDFVGERAAAATEARRAKHRASNQARPTASHRSTNHANALDGTVEFDFMRQTQEEVAEA